MTATLKDPRRLREQRRTDIARGEYREATNRSFGEHADEWVAHYQGRTDRAIRESTRKDYQRALKKAKQFFDVEKWLRLAEIEPQDVCAYISHLAEPGKNGKGLSRSTVQRYLAPLKALFADAVEDGILRSNPANVRVGLGAQSTERKVGKRALTREELEALLNAAPEEWVLFARFMVNTGLRISEAIELRWRDVEFGTPTMLHVSRAFSRGEVNPPKSKHGARSIPLSPDLARDLFRVQGEADELVFANEVGHRLDPVNLLKRMLRPIAHEASIEWPVGLHSLRHTCASLLFAEGRNAKQVRRWLGHHSAAFTLDTYVHLMDDGVGSADFFDDLLLGERSGEQNSPKQAEVTAEPVPLETAA